VADPRGFLKFARSDAPKRPIEERRADWHELYAPLTDPDRQAETRTQAARCMDCGIPFCHSGSAGCPLGNLIPEWNEYVRVGDWPRAVERLHATNNFPEFTGALCPAPCEAACVLSITDRNGGPVTIKRVEWSIAEVGWEQELIAPQNPAVRTGKRVAVVGSGPAGLAAAQQLTRAGHDVTVYERDDRIGGLLRYGIPEFKFEKHELDRRLEQMRAEGTRFVVGCEVGGTPSSGTNALPVERLRAEYDAVVLAVGALASRDDDSIPGRDLEGIHLAMDYLTPANRECEGDGPSPINARGQNVVIIGGGDTGADCYGTATRQGAIGVHQLDQYPPPPRQRDDARSPWPTWPYIVRTPPALEEGGERLFATAVQRFVGDDEGHVRSVELATVEVRKGEDGSREVIPTSEQLHEMPCDLVLFSIGFTGPDDMPLLPALGIERTSKGSIGCGSDWQTDAPGVFVCGDAHRGASLIVWAIAEGRSAAAAVDRYLDPTGATDLPAPVHPGALPLSPV
jgi:glutamate synthase (NADPH/NADH) small chain